MHPFQSWLVRNTAMTVGSNLVRNHLTGNAWNWGLVRSVNVRDYNAVGIVERAPEFFSKEFCARVAMRLKHRKDPITSGRSRRFQRCFDFSRVMAVVVDQQKPRTVVFDFEAPPRVLKLGQRLCDFVERNAELGCQRNHAECVANVVLAWDVEDRLTQFFFATINAKR